MRVLVVEDEPRMASVIRRSLAKQGLAADVAGGGEQGVWIAAATDYDAIALDVMLPDRSGFEVCRALRERGVWSPVLMLTARDAVADRVEGLDSGADDYLVKPFALAELHARLRSLARRGKPERPAVIEVGDISLDPARREVRRDGQAMDLSVVVAHRSAPLTAESGGRLIERGESFAQLTDERGLVVDATRPIGQRPLIATDELRRALRTATFVNRPSVPGLNEPARLLAI